MIIFQVNFSKYLHVFPHMGDSIADTLYNSPAPIAQLVESPLRGTGGHGFDPWPRHAKVVKHGISCSSLGSQTYGVEPVSG